MTSREEFEAWWEENYHNGNPPRFGWEAWRDGDGYQIDDDESELDGMWNAWQAAELASGKKLTDMAVQLANAESKCRELAAEISRRDEIFVPVYPDENTMNRMTDVFHDTAKIYCDEDSIFVDNAELVITAIINHYIKSGDAFLAEVRAQGVEMFAERKNNEMMSLHPDTHAVGSIAAAMSAEVKELREFAAKLRKGAAL